VSGWANMTETAKFDALHGSKDEEVGCCVGVDVATVLAGALGGSKREAVFEFSDSQ